MEACGRWNSRCMGGESPGHRGSGCGCWREKVVGLLGVTTCSWWEHIVVGKILCYGRIFAGLMMWASNMDAFEVIWELLGLMGWWLRVRRESLSSAFLAQCWVRKGWNTWSWEGGCCSKLGISTIHLSDSCLAPLVAALVVNLTRVPWCLW